MTTLTVVASFYLVLAIGGKLYEVFTFGKERAPSSPALWLIGLILNLPIYWILFTVIFS